MSLPRSVAEVLKQHVTLEVEGIDRMYLNVYQPRLQTTVASPRSSASTGGAFASSALMNPMSKPFIAEVDRFVKPEQIPLITFTRASARTTSPRSTGLASTARGNCRGGQGSGKDAGIPYREAPQS